MRLLLDVILSSSSIRLWLVLLLLLLVLLLVLLLLLMANTDIRITLIAALSLIVQHRGMEGRDVKHRAGVLSILLVVIVHSLMVSLLHLLLLMDRGRVRGSLLDLMGMGVTLRSGLMLINRNWIRLGNGYRNLFSNLDDLWHWHGDMLDHMDRIRDRVRHFDRVRGGDLHSHRLCNPNLFRRQMVFANECAKVLKLLLCMAHRLMIVALVSMSTPTIDSGLGLDGKESDQANDTENLQ